MDPNYLNNLQWLTVLNRIVAALGRIADALDRYEGQSDVEDSSEDEDDQYPVDPSLT